MRHWLPATILTINLLFPLPGVNAAQAATVSRVQRAVNLIYTDPAAAERQLKQLSSPTAKCYLAFLYLSKKVKTDHAGKKIDALMHAAANKVQDATALGELDASKHYHYQDMKMLLSHLRFITDADGYQVEVPEALFIQYPTAFEAWGPYWGSSRDGQMPVQHLDKYDIHKIPAVAAFTKQLDAMFGNQRSDCQGTIRYLYYRKQALAELEAALVPDWCEREARAADTEVKQKQLERFLHTWANQELWNQQARLELEHLSKAAEAPLASYYHSRFGLTGGHAVACARAALAGIKLSYLGEYSPSGVDDTRATRVYQVFSTNNLSLNEMQKQLGDKSLTAEDLPQALSLAILNNAELAVIDWLIKAGAPTSGGTEPPLLTAVLRPEVVSTLLKAGANVNEANKLGKTALIQAAQFNAGETIKVLLAAGADMNHAMVQVDCPEAQETIQDPDYNYTVGGRTALMYACAFSDYPTIMYLVDKGANKKALDSDKHKAVTFLSWNKRLTKTEKQKLEHSL